MDSISLVHLKDKYAKYQTTSGGGAIRLVPRFGSGANSDICNGPPVKTMANSLLRLNIGIRENSTNTALGRYMQFSFQDSVIPNESNNSTHDVLVDQINEIFPGMILDPLTTPCHPTYQINQTSNTGSKQSTNGIDTVTSSNMKYLPVVDYFLGKECTACLDPGVTFLRELKDLKDKKHQLIQLLDDYKKYYQDIEIMHKVNIVYRIESPKIRKIMVYFILYQKIFIDFTIYIYIYMNANHLHISQ